MGRGDKERDEAVYLYYLTRRYSEMLLEGMMIEEGKEEEEKKRRRWRR